MYELVQRRHNPSLHFGLGLRLGLGVRAEVGVSRVCKTDLTLDFFFHVLRRQILRFCNFEKKNQNASAVSSINLGSILIFASCVIHLPLVCPTDVVRVKINSQL